ncbi:MAG: hypothetical protein A3F84_21860 [Candidatus Handelsmanbacteria bacterium RIFCSPLOWO2_12_FULL_64_10]|uniref:CopZ zinc binding domain-containing protein n=1 Tax=Handelsmanbacteria sp. (strain RIFCSPLOWO2_12_FULL_64_10) TaxID=1817868 RepID=A0A1F6D0C5_HANXR|nr:MAG: hypothetical protein A3F84_21860 [Candidatus Handelsmanbacteria bacterium RIFCSPLOWO2_12_FULL_64_10]
MLYTRRTEGQRGVCPECGRKRKGVEQITLEHLLKEDRILQIGAASYLFCENPTCDVVYFSTQPGPVFHKSDLRVRVGLKETEAPIPVCYCFGYTEKMIFDEIAGTGRTAISEKIRAEVQAGNCECVVKNPQGTCCLGDVGRAVKRAMREVGRPA